MTRRLLLLTAICMAPAPIAQASGVEFCTAALAYIEQAPPEAVFHVWKRPLTIDCDAAEEADTAFCEAIIARIPFELPNLYPLRLAECLKANGARIKVRTTGETTAMTVRKIVRLRAQLKSGKVVTLDFAPDVKAGMDNFYGRYDLMVSPAR